MSNTASSSSHPESERKQTVVFLRHGVALHNVLDARSGRPPDSRDPALWDPPLTLEGRMASIRSGSEIHSWWRRQRQQAWNNNNDNISNSSDLNTFHSCDTSMMMMMMMELIVTSPLTRCLQTATLAFLPGDHYAQPSSLLPFICKEHVREAFGMHYPDRRRDKSVLQTHWPFVKFEETMTEQDDAWRMDWRETWDDVRDRVRYFVEIWLVQQPQNNIVVVSHGVWIEALLRQYVPRFLEGGKRVYNSDAYACQCVSRNNTFIRMEYVQQICGSESANH